MSKVLVISSHTDLENDSLANKIIINTLREKELPEAEYLILDKEYPNRDFDVAKEQERLKSADIIVIATPFFWFDWTSLIQNYIEKIFLHGFSHGTTGNALEGKKVVMSITLGAPAEAYSKDAIGFTLDDLMLNKVKLLSGFCKMRYCGEVVLGDVSYSLRTDSDKAQLIQDRSQEHAKKIAALVKSL